MRLSFKKCCRVLWKNCFLVVSNRIIPLAEKKLLVYTLFYGINLSIQVAACFLIFESDYPNQPFLDLVKFKILIRVAGNLLDITLHTLTADFNQIDISVLCCPDHL